jgi:hypothetical protein
MKNTRCHHLVELFSFSSKNITQQRLSRKLNNLMLVKIKVITWFKESSKPSLKKRFLIEFLLQQRSFEKIRNLATRGFNI